MSSADFKYEAPDSVESAFRFLLTREGAALLGGGTDLLPLIKQGVKKPSCLIDLRKISTLTSVTLREKGLFIGAMVTLADLSRNSLINRSIAILCQSARSVASPQIRNVATLGGNLFQERRCLYFNQSAFWRQSASPCFKLGGMVCHQVPGSKTCRAIYYSDTAPVLLSFDAEAEFYTQNGFQTGLLRDLIRPHGTEGQEKFLLTGIFVPYPPERTRAKFFKWSLRQSIDFPSLNGAIRISPPVPEKSQDSSVKILIGAVGPEPTFLEETAAFLVSNFSRLPSVIKEIKECGVRELRAKSSLIRETGLSLKSKQNLFHLIFRALDELLDLSESA